MSPTDPLFGQADLTDCDREPICIPGSIQPHGILIALDPGSMTIVQVAGDTDRLLGQAQERLLGQLLSASLDAVALARIESMIHKQEVFPRPFFIIDAVFGGRPLDISAHLSGGLVILELEVGAPRNDFDAIEAVAVMTARADGAATLQALLELVVAEVGAVSGFDRVMLYRFDDDDSGHVVAEHRRADTVESFLDLHYPASDIPVQARALYCNNWIRLIPDVGYRPEPLSPPDNPLTGQPLDLGCSALRSVSPVHIEYLGNMGVKASMSLSLVIDGKLWGLVACHHNAPLYVGGRVRAALELFAQLVSMQVRGRIDLSLSGDRIFARDFGAQMVTAMTAGGLERLVSARPNLLDLIPAAGAALVLDGEITTLGETPAPADIGALVQWLGDAGKDSVFATDRLGEHFPRAARFHGAAGGLLALSIARAPRRYVLWFLPERNIAVTWAGKPGKAVVAGPLGDRLTPRKSFAAWVQTVRGCSRPWTLVELESATALRMAILEVILHQIEQTAHVEEGLAKDRLDLLMAELDHRVKNTLATIQAVVRFSGENADNIVDYSRALERRIGAMAKSHSRLTAGRWKGAPLRKLIEDELSSHRPFGHDSVELNGGNYDLDPKATVAVSLVLHELATNAVKHGSLSAPGGQVSITWSKVRHKGQSWLAIDWRETGGPPVTAPTRSGFGRMLLERVFAADVQGRATLDFRPEGVRCVLEIPYDHVVIPMKTEKPSTTAMMLAATQVNDKPLQDLRVLVVEDGALVSLELCETLVGYGATIVGPCYRIGEAMDVGASAMIDVALLDVDLDGTKVFPVAELLGERDIPFVFATGFTDATLRPAKFRDARTIHKPYDSEVLLSMMSSIAVGKRTLGA